jgi:hypothetical protein
MAKEEAGSAQSQQIDTTQPTPLKGLVLRGVKATPEVLCVNKGAGKDGEDIFFKVAKANFDEKIHTKADVDKLPTRKKTKEKANNKAKKKAKKKKDDDK